MTPSLEKLISKLGRLPGVGRKSAVRMAYYILGLNENDIEDFANALIEAKRNVKSCGVCQCFCEDEICEICASQTRNRSVICVVEDDRSVNAFEDLREFNGLYHVLQGVISPMNGITPEHLKIKELLLRTKGISEIIVATNPSVEGEATAMYISRLFRPMGIKVTRLAYGLPVGATLEYADSVTLLKAFEGRTEV